MTERDQGAVAGGAEAPITPRPRLRAALSVLGHAAAVVAVVLFLNFGSLPAGVTLGQLVVLGVAISTALVLVRWARRGVLRRRARRRVTRMIVEYGGGLYGTIAVATWVYLQAADLHADIVAAGSFGAFVGSITIGWLIGEAIEAFVFGIQALIWPWYWFAGHGLIVPAVIAAGVWSIDGLRRPAARWWRRRAGPQPSTRADAPPPAAAPARTGGGDASGQGAPSDAAVPAVEPAAPRIRDGGAGARSRLAGSEGKP